MVSLEKEEEGKVTLDQEEFDNVFQAIGRAPETKKINLENLGVQLAPNKKIITNEKWQSTIPNIFAIGDVNSRGLELTPVAIKEGEYLVNGLFTGEWK